MFNRTRQSESTIQSNRIQRKAISLRLIWYWPINFPTYPGTKYSYPSSNQRQFLVFSDRMNMGGYTELNDRLTVCFFRCSLTKLMCFSSVSSESSLIFSSSNFRQAFSLSNWALFNIACFSLSCASTRRSWKEFEIHKHCKPNTRPEWEDTYFEVLLGVTRSITASFTWSVRSRVPRPGWWWCGQVQRECRPVGSGWWIGGMIVVHLSLLFLYFLHSVGASFRTMSTRSQQPTFSLQQKDTVPVPKPNSQNPFTVKPKIRRPEIKQ